MKRIIYILFITVLISGLYGCKCNNKNNLQEEIGQDTTGAFNEMEFFSKIDPSKINAINEIVGSFSSPIEMAARIRKENIPFSKKYLAPPDIVDNYETNIKKAYGLGVLSADLGYLIIYKKNNMMIDYLISVKKLSDDLKVAQYFNFQLIKDVAANTDNLDTLVFISMKSFQRIDAYFRQSNRSYLSVLSVLGTWVESFYLITQVAKDNPQYDFKDIIGSQKELLTKLIEVVKVYQGHPTFDYIIKELDKLQLAFEPVKITEQKVEPKIIEKDGNLVIYPDVETVIEMPEGTLDNIIKTTEQVRNRLLNLQ